MTKNDPFKYFKLDGLKQSSPIVFLLNEDYVQDYAEANLGRRLTDRELFYLNEGFFNEPSGALHYVLVNGVEYAIKAAEEEAK